jgi:hypothetical protein
VKSIITSRIRTNAGMTARGDAPMLTARHPVDFAYTRAELEAIFHYAREHDVEKGGRYDARAAAAKHTPLSSPPPGSYGGRSSQLREARA